MVEDEELSAVPTDDGTDDGVGSVAPPVVEDVERLAVSDVDGADDGTDDVANGNYDQECGVWSDGCDCSPAYQPYVVSGHQLVRGCLYGGMENVGLGVLRERIISFEETLHDLDVTEEVDGVR